MRDLYEYKEIKYLVLNSVFLELTQRNKEAVAIL